MLKLEIFISWSGEKSHKLALLFREWITNVIQQVKPFVSSEDIEKGSRWPLTLATKLDNCRVGIICVTSENLDSPWLNFEAGAISKKLGENRVCTLLLDIGSVELKGPLTQFQATVASNKEDLRKLTYCINDWLENGFIDEIKLEKCFEKWWDEYQKPLNGILTDIDSPKYIKRSDRELIEEILNIVRLIEKNGINKDCVSIIDEDEKSGFLSFIADFAKLMKKSDEVK